MRRGFAKSPGIRLGWVPARGGSTRKRRVGKFWGIIYLSASRECGFEVSSQEEKLIGMFQPFKTVRLRYLCDPRKTANSLAF